MGQAKKRGTFEERQRLARITAADAAAKRLIAAERARIEEQACVDAMPEAEREVYVQARRAELRKRRTGRAGAAIALAAAACLGGFY